MISKIPFLVEEEEEPVAAAVAVAVAVVLESMVIELSQSS